MKKFYKQIFMAALFIGAAPLVTSCDEQWEADGWNADEWSATYVYLQREDYLIGATKTFNLSHSAEGIGGDEVSMAFAVKAQKPVAKDVVVTLNAVSEGFDVDNIKLSASQVTIKAGERESEEVLATVDRTIFGNTEDKTTYSFKISIGDMNTGSGNTYISKQLNSLPAVINKSAYCNLKKATPANSTLLKTNTEWDFVFQDGVENQGSNSVNGMSGSDVATNGVPFWITVDLKEVKTVTGIQTTHWGSGSSYAPSQIELYTSDNGRDWKSMGVLDTSGNPQNITLIVPAQTRYLKYQMVKVPGRVDITRFYVYVANE